MIVHHLELVKYGLKKYQNLSKKEKPRLAMYRKNYYQTTSRMKTDVFIFWLGAAKRLFFWMNKIICLEISVWRKYLL